jgi:hypothetical protein
MKRPSAALLGLLLSVGALGETVNAPAVKPGDTWTYRNTTEKSPTGWSQVLEEITVARVTPTSIYFTTKPPGSALPPRETFTGADWSRVRDIGGQETLVGRPLSFPLAVGKTWELEYTDTNPGNKEHRSEHFHLAYSVSGRETVEVPAGRFDAFKVEADGRWTAELAPAQKVVQSAQSTTAGTSMATETQNTQSGQRSGRLYREIWYVPAVKRWVKAVEEYYSSGGIRNERVTVELESFKLAD